MSKEHRLYAAACRASRANWLKIQWVRKRSQTATKQTRLYFAFNDLVAIGRLVLMDQNVTVVGAIGLEPMTSCV